MFVFCKVKQTVDFSTPDKEQQDFLKFEGADIPAPPVNAGKTTKKAALHRQNSFSMESIIVKNNGH